MPGSDTEVAVVGSANLDLVASVATLPKPGETVASRDYQEFVGGKGCNQAVAAARLGRRVAFVGLVGDDEAGSLVRAALADEGVDMTHTGTAPGRATGRAIVLVDADAENCIVVVGGANAHLAPEHVRTAGATLRSAAVVVAQLEVPDDAVVAAARACEGTFLLNAAPARTLPPGLLDLVGVLVVNETEYEAVTGETLPEDGTALQHAVAASTVPCDLVVTLGARGALVRDASGEVLHVAAPAVPVVDTTGAGDTFIGALADGLARGEALPSAVRWAVHAGAVAVGSLGATTGMPRPEQVRALLNASPPAPPVRGQGDVPAEGTSQPAT